jgi:hypothetical protein
MEPTENLSKHFEGKVVKFIVPHAPGGSIDIYSRAVALSVGDYLPGKPRSVLVENIPGGGGKRGVVTGMAAKPDGLSVTIVHSRWWLASLFGEPPRGFNHEKVGIIGNPTGRGIRMACIRTDVARSWDEVLKLGRPLVFGSTPPGGAAYLGVAFAEQVGAPLKVVRGFVGSVEIFPALVRGEIEAAAGCTPGSIDRLFPEFVDGGKISSLFWWDNPVTDKDFLKKVGGQPPYLLDILKVTKEQKEAFELAVAWSNSLRTFVLPPGIPDYIEKAWAEAFKKMAQDPGFGKRVVAMGRSKEELSPVFSDFIRDLIVRSKRLKENSPDAYQIMRKLAGQ